jgi:tRNA pseudouridine38-40 synthase
LYIVIMNRPLLRNFRAVIAYDGGGFCGSQLQKDGRTVLSELNKALTKVLAHPVRAKIASRTDAGVHATGQVISFRTSAPREPEEIYRALNGLLPGDIRVTDCREAGFDFHPRYSALGKVYLYRILRAKQLAPMSRQYVLFIEEHKPYDLELVKKCAARIEGEHDFRSFSPRLEDGENPVKNIYGIGINTDGELTEVRIAGSGFLYQMVRRIMGLLIAIAQGRESSGAVAEALKNPETGKVRYNAAPQGLFLERVMYTGEEVDEALRMVGKK